MSGLGGSIEDFYGEDASAYAFVSEDRDFAAQAGFLADKIVRLASGGRFLELFAGPARHSQELTRQHGVSCVAVDASPHMKRIATGAGGLPPQSYVVCRLPELPATDVLGGAFDGVSILRYSVGYLAPAALHELLVRLNGMLKPAGRIVFELHDLDLVRADFRDLEIRERTAWRADGTGVRCVWPASPLRWRKDDWVVEMEVFIQHLDGARVVAERTFQSIERIYAKSEIAALAQATGHFRVAGPDITSSAFAGGPLLVLERL